jgi:hypothetical protein
MKDQELFERSVAVLATAYKDGSLVSQSSCGCAVGNLVKACGVEVGLGNWYFRLHQHRTGITSYSNVALASGQHQIDITGYTMEEIDRIESAFEGRTGEIDPDLGYPMGTNMELYDRLVAVYEVLCEIHEVEEVHIIEPELVFVK